MFLKKSAAKGAGKKASLSKVFPSTDPHVSNAAGRLEDIFPGRVKDVNVDISSSNKYGKREVDIVMDQFYIQVKEGRGTGLMRQIQRTTDTMTDKSKIVIGYAPDNYSSHAWHGAAEKGIPIARNFEELIVIIKELSK